MCKFATTKGGGHDVEDDLSDDDRHVAIWTDSGDNGCPGLLTLGPAQQTELENTAHWKTKT